MARSAGPDGVSIVHASNNGVTAHPNARKGSITKNYHARGSHRDNAGRGTARGQSLGTCSRTIALRFPRLHFPRPAPPAASNRAVI